jgi:hypothetical protein
MLLLPQACWLPLVSLLHMVKVMQKLRVGFRCTTSPGEAKTVQLTSTHDRPASSKADGCNSELAKPVRDQWCRLRSRCTASQTTTRCQDHDSRDLDEGRVSPSSCCSTELGVIAVPLARQAGNRLQMF